MTQMQIAKVDQKKGRMFESSHQQRKIRLGVELRPISNSNFWKERRQTFPNLADVCPIFQTSICPVFCNLLSFWLDYSIIWGGFFFFYRLLMESLLMEAVLCPGLRHPRQLSTSQPKLPSNSAGSAENLLPQERARSNSLIRLGELADIKR